MSTVGASPSVVAKKEQWGWPVDEFTLGCAIRRGQWRQDGAARSWALARKLVFGLTLAIACQSALAQAMYRIKPLGFRQDNCSGAGAVGFNRADQVAGNACNAHGDFHAFLWKNDGTPMVDLGPPEVGSFSDATALNASGLVTGYARDSAGGYFDFVSPGDGTPMRRIRNIFGGSITSASAINDLGQVTGDAYTVGDTGARAFLWKNDGSAMHDLGTLGGDFTSGDAVNASGQVAGSSDLSGNAARHAFIWRNDGTPMVDLTPLGSFSGASAINRFGQVTGTFNPYSSRKHAFVWRNNGTPMQDLGTLGGSGDSYPTALNDAGQITGNSNARGKLYRYVHAFVWMNDGTPMNDLGTLGGLESFASDMNASGQVTGQSDISGTADLHAFLWRNDGTKIQDLNKLVDPSDPLKSYVTLTNGDFINDLGDIVADGTDSRTRESGEYLLQGTVLTLAPRSLAFGNQAINTSSAAKSVTMTNTSAKVVAITNIALKGSDSGQFASTNNCGSSLVGHAICTIKVTFKPTTKGTKSAALNVNGGGGGLRVVDLTGTGT
jgi:probable HAF family extracellular repeat protein